MELRVAKEFNPYPFGRYEDDGPFNGEAFRKNVLEKRFSEAREKDETLEVVLDDVRALSGAFLDEAFGEFAREKQEAEGLRITEDIMKFSGNEPYYRIYIGKIWKCINKHYPSENEND